MVMYIHLAGTTAAYAYSIISIAYGMTVPGFKSQQYDCSSSSSPSSNSKGTLAIEWIGVLIPWVYVRL